MAHESSPSLRDVHVLLVSESAESLELVASVLRYAGALVTPCQGTDRAVRALQRVKADVVVIDASSPDDDAWAAESVRALSAERSTVPTVVLTPLASPPEREPLVGLGVGAQLAKPVAVRDLRSVIVTLVRDARGGSPEIRVAG